MLLASLLEALDACAPTRHAEPWDNVGLLVGDPQDHVTGALIAIDVTRAVLDEARELGAELIIAYHPTWFTAKKRLVSDDVILAVARAGINLYSPHTALDAAQGGTNDVLADAADMCTEARVPLAACEREPAVGMGRIGPTVRHLPFDLWLQQLKRGLGLEHALVARPGPDRAFAADGCVVKVAVCAGAGDSVWQQALDLGADTFVTGELRHHHALAAIAHKMRVVCFLHSNSERPALPLYAAKLRQLAPDVTFRVSQRDADPYSFS